MKKWFCLIFLTYMLLFPALSLGYKVTTVSPTYYPSRYYNRGYYGYPPVPPPPPPAQVMPNIPYNNSTYYNYYNRIYPSPTPLISKSYKGTRTIMPYGYTTTYEPNVRNYGNSTVTQYYSPSSTNTSGRVLRYYY